MERMSQPAPIAVAALKEEKMPIVTPSTANTMVIAPKTDICQRFMATESVARVYSTPRMRNSWRNIANHSEPVAPRPPSKLSLD